jgi:uncharacterized membrane protein
VTYRLWLLAHLLGVIVWVGGMFFAHMALRPALAATVPEPSVRLRLMAATLGRFFGWVGWAVLLILLSGMMMMLVAGGARGMFAVPPYIHAMLALGLVMMAIFGHIRFALFKRLQRAVAASDWPAGGAALASIRQSVLANLLLGVAVVVVAIVGPGLA